MKYTKLGTTDIEISRLCLGCMSFGDTASKMHAWTLNPDESEAIIKHALDLEINFFDTANCYSAGRLARPTWSIDTLRSKTDVVAESKYDSTKDSDIVIVKRVEEIAYIEEPYVPHKIVGAV